MRRSRSLLNALSYCGHYSWKKKGLLEHWHLPPTTTATTRAACTSTPLPPQARDRRELEGGALTGILVNDRERGVKQGFRRSLMGQQGRQEPPYGSLELYPFLSWVLLVVLFIRSCLFFLYILVRLLVTL